MAKFYANAVQVIIWILWSRTTFN